MVCPVFGKEFYKLGSSIAALSKTFSTDTRRGMLDCTAQISRSYLQEFV